MTFAIVIRLKYDNNQPDGTCKHPHTRGHMLTRWQIIFKKLFN